MNEWRIKKKKTENSIESTTKRRRLNIRAAMWLLRTDYAGKSKMISGGREEMEKDKEREKAKAGVEVWWLWRWPCLKAEGFLFFFFILSFLFFRFFLLSWFSNSTTSRASLFALRPLLNLWSTAVSLMCVCFSLWFISSSFIYLLYHWYSLYFSYRLFSSYFLSDEIFHFSFFPLAFPSRHLLFPVGHSLSTIHLLSIGLHLLSLSCLARLVFCLQIGAD